MWTQRRRISLADIGNAYSIHIAYIAYSLSMCAWRMYFVYLFGIRAIACTFYAILFTGIDFGPGQLQVGQAGAGRRGGVGTLLAKLS